MEMMMSGTLLLLKQAGCVIHTINVANGCVGTVDLRPAEIAAVRWKEAQASAKLLGSIHHECLVDDLEVFYTQDLIRRVLALVRQVKPDIVLTQSMEDYMDDHMNTAKVAVTATSPATSPAPFRAGRAGDVPGRDAVPRDSPYPHRHDAPAHHARDIRRCLRRHGRP